MQKIRQIHIVGEFANLMVRNYHEALQFVQDYFQMDFKKFIAKYFKGTRQQEINRNITPQKYHQLYLFFLASNQVYRNKLHKVIFLIH